VAYFIYESYTWLQIDGESMTSFK